MNDALDAPKDPDMPKTLEPAANRRVKRASRAIVTIALLSVLVLFLWNLGEIAREAGRRISCVGDFKIIGLAMYTYHDIEKHFLPAYLADKDGKPAHSWRMLILPYLCEEGLYDQYRFDEAWDSPHNSALGAGFPTGMSEGVCLFHCQSDSSNKKLETNKVMIVGKEAFGNGSTLRRIEEITDGISYTIAAAEMTDSGIHWMEPRDLEFEHMTFKINDPTGPGIRSKHPGLANALMADGSVSCLKEDINPNVLKAMLTIAGGEPVTRDIYCH